MIQASRECVYKISNSTSSTVIGAAGAALARRVDGRVKVPTSPVVSVTARLAGLVTSQESDVTTVVGSKAWRVPMWVSLGRGVKAEAVVEMDRERWYVAIEPVDVAAATMDVRTGEKWMSRTPNGTGRVWLMWLGRIE